MSTSLLQTTTTSRLKPSKKMLSELLLVVSVLGSKIVDETTGEEGFQPVVDCVNWLQDLQRALRREDDDLRPLSLTLSSWSLLPKKLIPITLTSSDNPDLLITLTKLFIILTKPISIATRKIACLNVDLKSSKVLESTRSEQRLLKANAISQSQTLQSYKTLFITTPGLLGVFVSLLSEPLSHSGSSRRDGDNDVIELVLHLFRNLLSINPITPHTTASINLATQTHHSLISTFAEEMVLDVILNLTAEVEDGKNDAWNLLLMEIVGFLVLGVDGCQVAKCGMAGDGEGTGGKHTTPGRKGDNASSSSSSSSKHESNRQHQSSSSLSSSSSSSSQRGSLHSTLLSEKLHSTSSLTNLPSRHSRFGGTILLNRSDGSDTKILNLLISNSDGSGNGGGGVESRVGRRKNKDASVWRAEQNFEVHSSPKINTSSSSSSSDSQSQSPTTLQAYTCLHTFTLKFLKSSYGPLLKSLKNEFRRESTKLEVGDRLVYFRIVTYFSSFYRTRRALLIREGKAIGNANGIASGVTETADADGDADGVGLGDMIFTLDLFSFNKMCLESMDTYIVEKKPYNLSAAVRLYREMVSLLVIMSDCVDSDSSLSSSNYEVMTLGLMQSLFYITSLDSSTKCTDRLAKLFTVWQPTTFAQSHAEDLCEVGHLVYKLLATFKKRYTLQNYADGNKGPVDENGDLIASAKSKNNKLRMLKQTCADFNLDSWLERTTLNTGGLRMYAAVLEGFGGNCNEVNHWVTTWLVRICKVEIKRVDLPVIVKKVEENGAGTGDGVDNDNDIIASASASKTTPSDLKQQQQQQQQQQIITLEPLLYTLPFLQIFTEILSTQSSSSSSPSKELLNLAKTIVRHFFNLSYVNPMVFVEGLFNCGVGKYRRYCEVVLMSYWDCDGIDRGYDGGYGGGDRKEKKGKSKKDNKNAIETERVMKEVYSSDDQEGEWESEEEVSDNDSDDDDDDDDEKSSGDDDDDDAASKKESKKRKKRSKLLEKLSKTKKSKKNKKSRIWSEEEDMVLRSAFFVYPTAKDYKKAIRSGGGSKVLVKGGKDKKACYSRAKVLGLIGGGNDGDDVDSKSESESKSKSEGGVLGEDNVVAEAEKKGRGGDSDSDDEGSVGESSTKSATTTKAGSDVGGKKKKKRVIDDDDDGDESSDDDNEFENNNSVEMTMDVDSVIGGKNIPVSKSQSKALESDSDDEDDFGGGGSAGVGSGGGSDSGDGEVRKKRKILDDDDDDE